MKNDTNATDGHDDITLERLRATRTKYEADLKQSGSRAGERFAMCQADFAQLKRLQRWSIEIDRDADHFQGFVDLAKLMANEDGSEKDLEKVMRQECGGDIDEPDWITGFVEGALAKFEEFEPKL